MGEKKKSAHQALYRKYRSKSLSDIVGQEHITKTLENALKSGKISHAYLFTGPRGTGKTSIARILAHEINGIPYDDDSPHLDIIEIDAASNRRIDDIRDLRDKVNIAPLSVKYKVYIIDEVHMLTTESFNALLKTLEEPPAHVVFILATTEVHKLPATIISRTQRHSFKSIPVDQVVGHLKHIARQEKITVSDEALQLLATHGNGSFRDSISLLDQLSAHDGEITTQTVELLLGIAPQKQMSELLSSMESGDASSVIQQVRQLIDSGITASGIAAQLAITVRDAIVNGAGKPTYVTLLNDLLSVHGSTYVTLQLEATLLKHTAEDAKPQQAGTPVQATVTTPVKTASVQSVAQPKPSSSKKTPPKKVETPQPASDVSFDITDQWSEVLSNIKAENNSLYTVLRLAQPEVKSGVLRLTFKFPFHQKRADDAKNKAIIAAAVSKATDHQLIIETVLDKASSVPEPVAVTSTPTPPDPAHASVISTVQDIMGGGEVVNV